MIGKGRHPKKPIAEALGDLDPEKLTVEEIHKGHRWGRVMCDECGADQAVFSTPRVPENNARDIARFAADHRHPAESGEPTEDSAEEGES